MESKRVLETKKKVQDAFFELYQSKGVDKITVKEITKLAGINRSTFYVYYEDVYNLQERIEEEYFAQVREKIEFIITELLNGENMTHSLPSLDFIKENKHHLKVFLSKTGEKSLPYRIKALAKEIIRKKLCVAFNQSTRLEYVLEYMTSAQLGMITHWVQNDLELSPEELLKTMYSVNLNGPISLLKQLKNGSINEVECWRNPISSDKK